MDVFRYIIALSLIIKISRERKDQKDHGHKISDIAQLSNYERNIHYYVTLITIAFRIYILLNGLFRNNGV